MIAVALTFRKFLDPAGAFRDPLTLQITQDVINSYWSKPSIASGDNDDGSKGQGRSLRKAWDSRQQLRGLESQGRYQMSKQNEELERLMRLRERQIQARDPKAKEKKIQAKVTARRRKLRRSRNTSFQYMIQDMLRDMSYKFWGIIIGAVLGTIVSIVLALLLEDIVMVAVLGLVITLVLILVGFIFGHSFDWRAEVTDEFKDL
jgi:hypothetical protein